MRALLIVPSMDNGYWKKLGKKVGPKSEPLNLLYIATFLNKNGHHAEILDCEAEGLSVEDVEEHLRNNTYDVVGVTMLTPTYGQAVAMCATVRKVLPNAKIIVGGSHVGREPEAIIAREKNIDVAVIGEAELTFLNLLNMYEQKKDLSMVKGIAYRDGTTIKKNEAAPPVQDLDLFPIPDRKLIKMELYRPSVSYYRRLPAYTMITTRGCPFRCTFCATAKTGYRMHSVKRVIEEMRILVEEFGAKEILFRDDTFTLYRERTVELCNAIIDAGLHERVRWDCITRAGLVTPQLLKKMKQAGCWGIHFGVEGGTQRLLDVIQKDSQPQHYKNAFKWARMYGLETRGYFMIGLPTSTYEDDLATIEFAKELDPDWAQFTITLPYPGTQLMRDADKYGTLNSSSADWSSFQTWGGFSEELEIPWVAKGRTSEELKELQKKALKDFYFRPKVIARKIRHVDNWPILKKYVVGALALAAGGSGRAPE